MGRENDEKCQELTAHDTAKLNWFYRFEEQHLSAAERLKNRVRRNY